MKKLITILFAVALGLNLSAQVPDYVPNEGLVGWYPFNGNANDESGNGFDATPTNVELTADRSDIQESAYHFDYNQYSNGSLGDMVWVPHESEFNTPELTVSVWFKQTDYSYPGNPGSQAIIKRVETGYSNPPGEFWSITMDDEGTIGGAIFNSTVLNASSASGFIALNEWYHAVLTYDTELLRLYVNGESIAEDSGADLLRIEGVSGVSIGVSNQANGYWRPFHGIIDDAGMWNRALTEEEIQALYNAELSVPGCTDLTACNFNEEANIDDGSCVYPPSESVDCEFGGNYCGEGTIWDASLQACVAFDDCPADLNGNGLVEVSDLLMVLADFGTECAPPVSEWTCGDPVNYHGYDYATVQIGEQCWFAENLRSEDYANGDVIPGELSNSAWSSTNSGAQAVYNNDASNLADYGRLYNWYAVDDARGLCPTGWHVPTDGEYAELTDFLGGSSIAGTQMKSSPSDDPAWDGTNTSGFSALAGGVRNSWGDFIDQTMNQVFWTHSVHSATGAFWRKLISGSNQVDQGASLNRNGYSVRCLRDE